MTLLVNANRKDNKRLLTMPAEEPMINKKTLRFLVFAILVIVPGVIAQQRKPATPQSARLYVFDCGSLNIPDTSPYQLKKDELATTYMSVPCFLVVHPKGTLMWDVGAVPDTAFKAGGGGSAMLRYATSTKPLTWQLAE